MEEESEARESRKCVGKERELLGVEVQEMLTLRARSTSAYGGGLAWQEWRAFKGEERYDSVGLAPHDWSIAPSLFSVRRFVLWGRFMD